MTIIFWSLIILWLVSLCCHEYAHARVAYAGGDTSVVAKGYLTMNPLRYLHPVTSILMPLVILAIGGVPLPGGAVYIDHTRLRSRGWESAVSAAGPAANLALFLLAAAPFMLGLRESEAAAGGSLWVVLATFGFLQFFSVLLNLLPVPGLDGFGIIAPYLPYKARRFAYEHANTMSLMLFLALILPTPLSRWLGNTAVLAATGMGLPFRDISEGYQALRGMFR